MIRYVLFGCVILVSLTSCRKDILASESWDMPEQHWLNGDDKKMSILASDSIQAYNMDIRLDYNADYKYQNLYIRLLTTFPSGKKISSVTSLELANPDGSWSGECSGKTCSVTLPLQQRFNFPELGTYELTVQPFMRMDTIEGIKHIELTCRKRAG